ncbi:hypothetical protein EF888_17840 [Silicimonas algicola]|uniref:Uncharacterized protein n=1 Tax=Silicimonas algicola TaxID=1826607 RepID=A0A316G587_9RHOB|nr:hypothetical protein [Silicimonas algicola]AZQ68826.1 hypothetical protein EF888_17840 [Silicimonas algicola]PWK56089.1 hypothetical protein C8D95_105154 [Silicimonas algicola]
MGRGSVQERHVDFSLGLAIARRYYDAAADFLPTDPQELEISFAAVSDRIAFAASNLIFSTELYIRNAAIDRKNAPSHHNVWSHYRRIAPDNRSLLQERFNDRIGRRTHPVSLSVVVSHSKKLRDEQVKELASTDPSRSKGEFLNLERILKDTGESYSVWRYLYQSIAAQKDHKIVRLHYVHLFCLCECLDEILAKTYGHATKDFVLSHHPIKRA